MEQLRHIPTVGSSGILTSYLDAFKFFFHGHEIVQEGYTKYYGTAFKIPIMSRWLVIISGPQMVDDIRRAGNDVMSFDDAVAEGIQTDYTMGENIRTDCYHTATVRSPLTRNIAARFSDIRDEIIASFSEIIPAKENEWTAVPALPTLMKIVCRTSNRLFVGLPLCRNPDYMELNQQFTIDVVGRGQIINMFPNILKPIVGRLVTNVSANLKRAIGHVGPMIKHQLEQDAQQGSDWQDKPNNLISWLLEDAKEHNRTVEDLALRVLAINFAAIHTTSHALTNALFDLVANPEYIEPLRKEAEAVIESEGWNKLAMGKLRKLDSFIKESQRMAIGAISMNRKLMKDFTFSNGVTVPAGTHVAVAVNASHMDDHVYDDPQVFKGFRFVDMRDEEGENIKHQIVSLSPDYLTFGTGRHACPGRFFAANELKAMMAHILLTYDVKLAGDSRPQNFWFQGFSSPNRKAEVLFRKRAD
ncbi:cytochrome P450 [Agrocybe pediades]|nr:cytochrome P450 [Agrocybe pediades]